MVQVSTKTVYIQNVCTFKQLHIFVFTRPHKNYLHQWLDPWRIRWCHISVKSVTSWCLGRLCCSCEYSVKVWLSQGCQQWLSWCMVPLWLCSATGAQSLNRWSDGDAKLDVMCGNDCQDTSLKMTVSVLLDWRSLLQESTYFDNTSDIKSMRGEQAGRRYRLLGFRNAKVLLMYLCSF